MTRKTIRWLLFGLSVPVVLVLLFYAEEDFRGWYAWHYFQHQWQAKGEKFDRASVVPPAVPDDQNFAMAPIWIESVKAALGPTNSLQWFKKYADDTGNTNFVNRLDLSLTRSNADWPPNAGGSWQKGKFTDLTVWQNYYRNLSGSPKPYPVASWPQTPAQDVLLALSKYDGALKELRDASSLPDSRFPLAYDWDNPSMIMLPHLAMLKRCSQILQLRAVAELENNQSDLALADIKLSLRLIDSVRTEPILISHLVRIAMLQITLQPVWEGLAEHKWSEAQLADLDAELARLDFLADYQLSMRSELVLFQAGIFDYLRRHPQYLHEVSQMTNNKRSPSLDRLSSRLAPSGWLYQNQVRSARPVLEFYLPLADLSHRVVSPTAVRHAQNAVAADVKTSTLFNVVEQMLPSGLDNAARRFAFGQSSADLARTAIALERYRLAHGSYPKTLDDLAPSFMAAVPHDIINGDPLQYRVEYGGQFVLYSVGWNETDDDGRVVLQKRSTPAVDLNQGDWVWRYPAR